MAIQYQKYSSSLAEWQDITQLLTARVAPQYGVVGFNTETERDLYFSLYPEYLSYNLIVVLFGTNRALKFNQAHNSQYLSVI